MGDVEILRQGVRIHRSRNLRGLLDYARRNSVRTVLIERTHDGGANVFVTFYNGATCLAEFADYKVACPWIKSRRSWSIALVDDQPRSQKWETI